MTPPAVLLYDWDNTLVDGWAGITAALNAAFAAFAMPLWTVERHPRTRPRLAARQLPGHVRRRVGTRARHLLRRAGTSSTCDHVRPMPGAAEALAAGSAVAAGRGVQQGGPLSCAPRSTHLGWARAFRRGGRRRRCAAPTSRTPRRSSWRSTSLAPAADRSVWYLGDTALDMQAARAAGVTAVLVGDAAHDGGIDRARSRSPFPCRASTLPHVFVRLRGIGLTDWTTRGGRATPAPA